MYSTLHLLVKHLSFQQNSPGFPPLEASERLAHKAQVGEEWRDGGSMEPSDTMPNSYDYGRINKIRKKKIHNQKTAQEIVDYMNSDDDELPDFTLEQLDLALQGRDSFIADGIEYYASTLIPTPVTPVSEE